MVKFPKYSHEWWNALTISRLVRRREQYLRLLRRATEMRDIPRLKQAGALVALTGRHLAARTNPLVQIEVNLDAYLRRHRHPADDCSADIEVVQVPGVDVPHELAGVS